MRKRRNSERENLRDCSIATGDVGLQLMSGRIQRLFDFVNGVRDTFGRWSEYVRRTGRLPWLSILAHTLNVVVFVSGSIFLFSWEEKHDWSELQGVGIFLLVAVPYVLVLRPGPSRQRIGYALEVASRISNS
jgi:hypothetical protein